MRKTEITVTAKHGETEFRLHLDGALLSDNRSACIIVGNGNPTGKTTLNIGGPGDVTIESAKEFLAALTAAIYLAENGISVR